MVRKAGAVGLLVAVALVAYFLLRKGDEADAEARYDGVHLCSPSQEAAATALGPAPAATRTPAAAVPRPSDGNAGVSPPTLFAQNDAAWGKQEYDHGGKQNVGCGTTIAQCGCAMTSVATVLRLFQVLTTPDGTNLNPSTLNAWFDKGAQMTGGGWVSQGYSYGNVVWTAVNTFSADVPGASAAPSHVTLKYKGWGTGTEQEIRSELAANRPVVLEVPGHFIAAVGIQNGQVQINDPYYRDRTALSAYAGRIKSSRLFQPSQDLGAIVINVPANQRVRVTDSQGRQVGGLPKGSPAEAEKNAKREVAGSSYHFEPAWRDPTCTERPPADGAGVNSIFLPSPANGAYQVEVLNPDGGDTSAAAYVYDRNGKLKLDTHGGGSDIRFQIDYDAGAGPTPTPQPTRTPTPAPSATRAPATAVPRAATAVPPTATDVPPPPPTAEPTSPPTVAPTATATPTRTPTPTLTPTITPTLAPTPVPGSLSIIQSGGPIVRLANVTSLNYTGDLGNFSLLDGQSYPSGPLSPGKYSVTQAPNTSWYVDSITCYLIGNFALVVPADYTTSNSDAGWTASVTLRPGQNVACTFKDNLISLR